MSSERAPNVNKKGYFVEFATVHRRTYPAAAYGAELHRHTAAPSISVLRDGVPLFAPPPHVSGGGVARFSALFSALLCSAHRRTYPAAAGIAAPLRRKSQHTTPVHRRTYPAAADGAMEADGGVFFCCSKVGSLCPCGSTRKAQTPALLREPGNFCCYASRFRSGISFHKSPLDT